MDNGAYQDPEKGTEMVAVTNRTNGVSSSSNTQPSTSCRPDVCQAARNKYTPPDLRGSPWHKNKTIYLGVTICSLVLWIIIYSTLSSLNLV